MPPLPLNKLARDREDVMTNDIFDKSNVIELTSDEGFLTICRQRIEEGRLQKADIAKKMGVSLLVLNRILRGGRKLTETEKRALCETIGLDPFHVTVVLGLFKQPDFWDIPEVVSMSNLMSIMVECTRQRISARTNDVYLPLDPCQLNKFAEHIVDRVNLTLQRQHQRPICEIG
ncbi:hypothetical protein SKA58_19360 [Sphingomonas sp. SKA58]|nr:hypothetical protein SKA58_19360 [Sphingomonas sp. SKA58]